MISISWIVALLNIAVAAGLIAWWVMGGSPGLLLCAAFNGVVGILLVTQLMESGEHLLTRR